MTRKVWDEITYPFLNFNGSTVEVKEWMSNFIPHFIMDVIIYPCWDMCQLQIWMIWDSLFLFSHFPGSHLYVFVQA